MNAAGPREKALRDMRETVPKPKPRARAAQPTAEAATKESAMSAAVETVDVATSKPPKPKKTAKPKLPKVEKVLAKKAAKKAASAKKPAAEVPVVESKVRTGSKLAIIVGLLQRAEGCTMADITAATGWKTMSFPQQAKAAGLTLRKEKDGSVSRYFAS